MDKIKKIITKIYNDLKNVDGGKVADYIPELACVKPEKFAISVCHVNGETFNIAGDEAFQLTEVIDLLIDLSTKDNITYEEDIARLRPIDADYQMFDNSKIKNFIDWEPEISVKEMLNDLLNHWREQIKNGRIPLNR